KKALRSACAIELVHTYSLIHDDLPCMDDDDYRRGRESCHKKFGEDIALLAGDALNTGAFQLIATEAECGNISAQTGIKLISILSSHIGVYGMIGGQVIDLESEGRAISLETLDTLQERKTGALIKAACLMGCRLGGCGEGDIEKSAAASGYAERLGKAFQIVDDILDVTGSFEELGKPIGSDEEQGKSTYVSLLGLEKAKDKARELTEEALSFLDGFEDNGFLKELTTELLTRNN
ncbi:MAG: polyprenyl synthetase family protein, partial [Ruminococcus sp.]|nr:polyprenyl synthetase family protein [Ruminococcus sp.]